MHTSCRKTLLWTCVAPPPNQCFHHRAPSCRPGGTVVQRDILAPAGKGGHCNLYSTCGGPGWGLLRHPKIRLVPTVTSPSANPAGHAGLACVLGVLVFVSNPCQAQKVCVPACCGVTCHASPLPCPTQPSPHKNVESGSTLWGQFTATHTRDHRPLALRLVFWAGSGFSIACMQARPSVERGGRWPHWHSKLDSRLRVVLSRYSNGTAIGAIGGDKGR